MVGHIQAVNGEYETISLFMNPGLPTEPTIPTAMATFAGVDATSLAQFSLRISAIEPEDVYLIDEIKIGEAYADVATIDPNFLLGDFNGDGSLEFGDFLVLANNLFEGTNYDQGDFDFSGEVDLLDFVLFREAYQTANSPAGAASVPEPSGMLLLGAATIGLLACRRRR